MADAQSARTQFKAPWGREVTIVSMIGVLTLGLPAGLQASQGHFVISTLLFGLLAFLIAQTVRGYELSGHELRIRRLAWKTKVWPLDGTSRATVRPSVMSNSWRVFGNGGFFSVTGRFSNSALGRYQAFVTDFNRTVVLDTQNGIIVVSPDDPAAFVESMQQTRSA